MSNSKEETTGTTSALGTDSTTEVTEAEESSPINESPLFDIYIRFNGDEERDYCFQVHADTTFGELVKIFDTLPLNLSPSIFYERIPTNFQLSTEPGVLTREGGLLFGDNAGKQQYLKLVRNDDVISEKSWPGQLIIPVFPERSFLKYSLISLLAVWLYTDLPDFISPTPGIGLLTALMRVAAYILTNVLNFKSLADSMLESVLSPTPIAAQILFFVLHIAKVLVIYLVMWLGAFNPYSIFKKAPAIQREALVKIGWTSSKKAIAMDFSKDYRTYRTSKVGGLLQAHRLGLLDKLRYTTVNLGPGEGFDSPLVWNLPKDTPDDGKFLLSYSYLKEQEEFFQERYSKVSDSEFASEYKHFRRYGPFDAPEKVTKFCDRRIMMKDGDITGKPFPEVKEDEKKDEKKEDEKKEPKSVEGKEQTPLLAEKQ
ncbi:hypothetical protein FOA43_001742 [Brettanomyces nanus]|uniref:Uncharacterized protein n=1 Tax=Eeniella nana TaxID=13502 RepID=A0A875S0J0_EENNA|nr:uncharacterized protein FOA43_001742 [Brettanomyces nanus]QPG74413.1 hypothetical protein FOA43_001742 [Brettanomyces nanus]